MKFNKFIFHSFSNIKINNKIKNLVVVVFVETVEFLNKQLVYLVYEEKNVCKKFFIC